MVIVKTDFIRFCKDCNELFQTNFRYATTCLACQIKNIKKNIPKSKIHIYIAKAKSHSKFIPSKKVIWAKGKKGY